MVECEKLGPRFHTCNNPHIHLCSKYPVVSILLCWISPVLLLLPLQNYGFGKAAHVNDAGLCKTTAGLYFFLFGDAAYGSNVQIVSAGLQERQPAPRSCLCSSCSLCCPTLLGVGGIISSASLQDLLVSHSAPRRAVFSFLLLLRVSAAPLMFDQPKKQPRGLFIPHVFRAKGRSSTVTDIRVELVRFDFFQPGCRLKRVRPLCCRQLRG